MFAGAVLLHLDRPQLATALARMQAAARDGGVLACTLKEGDGEEWSDHKLGRPRWFVLWRPPALRAAVEGAGWTVEALDADGRWLQVLARRESGPARPG